ncbi:MAG: chromosomal replication initiator protein DnaA [Planctomycetes bacterium]|nr:chromosomal replication initiator protein DnaA [Planctomycetota bacterium]
MKALTPELKDKIYKEIRGKLPPDEAASWMKSLEFLQTENGTLEIPLPNDYFRNWYEKHYKDLIAKTVSEVLGIQPKIIFKIPSDYQGTLFESAAKESGHDPKAPKPHKPAPEAKPPVANANRPKGGTLNSKYTFEQFVVGPCNRLAHAWSMAVAENPGKAYNPLFIHGSVGLGKTHLLQAACHYILAKRPEYSIYYLSCEGFVNDYISAVRSGGYDAFRNKYRSVDVLVIDDIHFLGAGEKQASQEEFFHTFNALHNAQKQIILSSDSPPQDIPTLEDRLVSRFKWGQVARLDSPTFETRMAIIKQTAEWMKKAVPDDVCDFIASSVESNIRDLEGALKNVIGFAEATKKPIDLALAKDSLRDLIGVSAFPVTIPQIQEVISKFFNVKISDLQSKKRVKSVSVPRQIGIYLARSLTSLSLEEIGAAFGGKDHSTVMYSVEKIKQRAHKDRQFTATLNQLTKNVKQGG